MTRLRAAKLGGLVCTEVGSLHILLATVAVVAVIVGGMIGFAVRLVR